MCLVCDAHTTISFLWEKRGRLALSSYMATGPTGVVSHLAVPGQGPGLCWGCAASDLNKRKPGTGLTPCAPYPLGPSLSVHLGSPEAAGHCQFMTVNANTLNIKFLELVFDHKYPEKCYLLVFILFLQASLLSPPASAPHLLWYSSWWGNSSSLSTKPSKCISVPIYLASKQTWGWGPRSPLANALAALLRLDPWDLSVLFFPVTNISVKKTQGRWNIIT